MRCIVIYVIYAILSYFIVGVHYVGWMIWVHPDSLLNHGPSDSTTVLVEATFWPLAVLLRVCFAIDRLLERALAPRCNERSGTIPQPPAIDCTTCGAATNSGARYCPRCGAGVRANRWQDQ